jgi:ribosomal protein L11 methyltransferase
VIRLAVRVARAQAEEALAELLVFAPAGVEEIDVDDQTIEYVLYGAPGELPALPTLRASVGGALVTVETSEIADDWAERWRAFHQPLVVSERLYVRPPWHGPAPSSAGGGLIDLVIEPGQAFGTGAHATTRLCLELLVELERAGAARGALLDIGCGSGLLAIAAAKLGFAPVLALDNDPAATAAARDNARANAVRIEIREWDLRCDQLPSAGTIVANLLLGPLLTLAERLTERPGTLIASGLLASQGDQLAAALESRHALSEEARRSDGDWLAMLFVAADPCVSS